jgi:CRISPR system Cascade subunit CasA
LLESAWLPVLRRRSGPAVIRPADLTSDIATDPVIALAWPRPDFQLAAHELLIGLLATLCPPPSHDAWCGMWETPPPPEALAAAFAPYARAFDLDGEGPRFLQDFAAFDGAPEPTERLLIDIASTSAGTNTDLMARQGRIRQLGRPAAAMALFALQAWAPPGGRGNRTGLRGGGPLTTLVLPGGPGTLWHILWANTPIGQPPAAADLPRVFPWLAPTVSSEAHAVVTPQTAHPSQQWWGMPRRIRLAFGPGQGGPCDLTGTADDVMVTGWRQRPNGANYVGWRHPLSPHYQAKAGDEWLAVHPQPDGIGYRHWIGLVLRAQDGTRLPAASVTTWRDREDDANAGPARLLAAGYDMDNMKARGFVEAELPLPAAPDPQARERLDAAAHTLVTSAELAAAMLRQAVRFALFSQGATVKFDAAIFAALRERFWNATEAAFHKTLADVAAAEPETPVGTAWQPILATAALALFDDAAPIPIDSDLAAPRISRARRQLAFALCGYGKQGAPFYERLGLPAPETRAPRKGKAA